MHCPPLRGQAESGSVPHNSRLRARTGWKEGASCGGGHAAGMGEDGGLPPKTQLLGSEPHRRAWNQVPPAPSDREPPAGHTTRTTQCWPFGGWVGNAST